MNKAIKIGFSILKSGLLLVLVGIAMLLFQVGIEGLLLTLPIAIISIGGIFAIVGLAMLVGRLFARKGSAFAKEVANSDKEIDIIESDERNIAISRRTSQSYLLYTGWLDSALLIFLMVMQVELLVILVCLAVYAVKITVHVILSLKYSKEM